MAEEGVVGRREVLELLQEGAERKGWEIKAGLGHRFGVGWILADLGWLAGAWLVG